MSERKGGRPLKYNWNMPVGDSIILYNKTQSDAAKLAWYHAKVRGMKFSTKSLRRQGGGIQITRIA